MKLTLTVSTKNLTSKQLTFLMNLIMSDAAQAWCRISKEEEALEEPAPQEKIPAQ